MLTHDNKYLPISPYPILLTLLSSDVYYTNVGRQFRSCYKIFINSVKEGENKKGDKKECIYRLRRFR